MKKSTRILLLLLLAASPPPQFPLELVFYHEPQLSWCLTSSVSRSVRRGAFVLPFIVSAYFKLSDRLRGSLTILNQKPPPPPIARCSFIWKKLFTTTRTKSFMNCFVIPIEIGNKSIKHRFVVCSLLSVYIDPSVDGVAWMSAGLRCKFILKIRTRNNN